MFKKSHEVVKIGGQPCCFLFGIFTVKKNERQPLPYDVILLQVVRFAGLVKVNENSTTGRYYTSKVSAVSKK